MPVREPAMRTIESSRCTSLRRKRAFSVEPLVYRDAQPCGNPQISWGEGVMAEQIAHLAMAPEQRGDQRSSARTVGFRIEVRASLDQCSGKIASVGIGRLMQRCPAPVVRVVHVRTGGEKSLDHCQSDFRIWF